MDSAKKLILYMKYYGCFWYGYPTCYRSNILNNKNQKDMGTLNKNTTEKLEIIKSAGYKHVEVYNWQLKNNKDFQKFVKKYNKQMVDRLNPRDALHGGGTNATKLLYNFKENECGHTLISVRYTQQFNIIKNIQ